MEFEQLQVIDPDLILGFVQNFMNFSVLNQVKHLIIIGQLLSRYP